jgi:hypothetical protein
MPTNQHRPSAVTIVPRKSAIESSRPPWPDVPEVRRRTMRAIRPKDTKPERIVRSLLHRLGYRFRVHGCVYRAGPT